MAFCIQRHCKAFRAPTEWSSTLRILFAVIIVIVVVVVVAAAAAAVAAVVVVKGRIHQSNNNRISSFMSMLM